MKLGKAERPDINQENLLMKVEDFYQAQILLLELEELQKIYQKIN